MANISCMYCKRVKDEPLVPDGDGNGTWHYHRSCSDEESKSFKLHLATTAFEVNYLWNKDKQENMHVTPRKYNFKKYTLEELLAFSKMVENKSNHMASEIKRLDKIQKEIISALSKTKVTK